MKKSSHTSYHTIQFHETDMAGFAHFPQAFLWAEKAELEFMKSIGLSLIETGSELMKAWPRVHVEADYIDLLRFEDKLSICIAIKNLGKHSITYAIEIFKLEQNRWTPAVYVRMKTVYVEGLGPGLPAEKAPIPEEVLNKIAVTTEPMNPPAPNK